MEMIVLFLLSGFVLLGIMWTVWDIHVDRRRKRR